MMTKSGLILLGVGALGYLAYKQWNIRQSVRMFQYFPAGVKLSVDGLALVVTFQMDVYNPNRTSVPITGIVGRLMFKGASIGTFVNTQPITINGGEKHRVEIKVRVSAVGVIQAITASDPNLTLGVDGLVKTGLFDVPIKVEQKLTGLLKGTERVGILPEMMFKKFLDKRRKKKKAAIKKPLILPQGSSLFNRLQQKTFPATWN